ncbi:hypothetical protein GCM10027417_20190 [Glutamicibacter endophyticus]
MESRSSAARLIEELSRGSRLLHVLAQLDATAQAVSNGAFHVLHVISKKEPTHAADVASVMGIGTAAVSRHLTELEGAGLIARHTCADDARRAILASTEAGRTALATREAHRAQRLTAALPQWSAEQMNALGQSLGELNDALREAIDDYRLRTTDQEKQA